MVYMLGLLEESARVFWSRGYDMSANNMFKMVFASAAVRFPKFLL
jgi:hypothetical protein